MNMTLQCNEHHTPQHRRGSQRPSHLLGYPPVSAAVGNPLQPGSSAPPGLDQ